MSRAALIGALLALAGCGSEASKQAAAPAPAEPAAETAPAAVPVAATPPPSGSNLTGDVSDLAGAVSGLSTRITDQGLVIDLPADALFEFDKADLTPAAEAELRKAAELIRRSPPGAVQVIGHTDSHGEDAYNQRLSEARARTVADWFGGEVGVRQRDFRVSGKGETAPVAPNARPDGSDDPEGRAKNRRVEVIVPHAG